MYEPTWSQPLENYQQTGSFLEPATPPADSPDAGTLVQLPCVNEDWLPLVLGSLDQLRNPSSWLLSLTDAQRYDVLGMVDRLRQMVAMAINVPCCAVEIRLNNCVLQFSVDGGTTWVDVTGWVDGFATCVRNAQVPNPPLLPPGSTPATRACNISGFLATKLIQTAIAQAVNQFNTTQDLLALATTIADATFAFDLPWTALFITAVYDVYTVLNAGNIAAFEAASTDDLLWALVACAIYSCTKLDGQVTPSNYPCILTAICGLRYATPAVIDAICQFVTNMGAYNLMALQVAGSLHTGDCSVCPTWCYHQIAGDANTNWEALDAFTHWVAGVGYCSGADVPDNVQSLNMDDHEVLGAGFDVNQFSVTINAPSGLAAGSRLIAYTCAHGTKTLAMTGSGTWTLTVNDCVTNLQIVAEQSPSTSGTICVTAMTITGWNVNPFGINNCS